MSLQKIEQNSTHESLRLAHNETVDAINIIQADIEEVKNSSVKSDGDSVIGSSVNSLLTNTVDAPLIRLNLYGKSTQDGAPTPDAPVDIASVGDDGAVNIIASGKNLVDLSSAKTNGGAIPEFVADGFRTNAKDTNSRIVLCDCNLIAGETYYLSYNYETENDINNTGVVAYVIGGGGTQYSLNSNVCFVAQYNSTKLGLFIPEIYASDDLYFTVTNLQIERGTNKTDYVPYQGCKTAEITSGLPLCSVGDVRDELVFNADGTGKVIKRTAKIDSYAGEEITGDYISSTGDLDAGATVVYVLDKPVEIHLTAEETASLGRLQTFDGITYVNAYDGADMSVRYCKNPLLGSYVFPLIKRFI